jgi:hypothetical protein
MVSEVGDASFSFWQLRSPGIICLILTDPARCFFLTLELLNAVGKIIVYAGTTSLTMKTPQYGNTAQMIKCNVRIDETACDHLLVP